MRAACAAPESHSHPLTPKLPAAVAEAAGDALGRADAIAARQEQAEVPTYPPAVLEGRCRHHNAAEATVPPPPDVGAAVADLGQSDANRLERGDLIAVVARGRGRI